MSDIPCEDLKSENQKLKRAVEELSILNDLAREIGASLDLSDIMRKIIRRALSAVHAEQGMINLVEEHDLHPMRTLVRTKISSSEGEAYHLDQCLLGWMHLNKSPLIMNDPPHDPRFKGIKWDSALRTILCVPLLIKSTLRGILTVFNKKNTGGFSEEDQRLLAIIAAQSAQIIENARLYEEEQALLEMREEIKFASEIQLGLLPKLSPEVEGYEITGLSIPAQEVGGDYFDFIPREDGQLAFCLGDVSGKGLGAALLMSNLQATIRGQTLVMPGAGDCLRRSNKLLFHSTDPQKFATLFYGILNSHTHRIHYANAGHDRPVIIRRGNAPIILEKAGIALSFIENYAYEEDVVSLEAGDVLLIYSDGITETMNERSEEFGIERLTDLVEENSHKSLNDVVDYIIVELQKFAGERPQMDDMTLVLIRRGNFSKSPGSIYPSEDCHEVEEKRTTAGSTRYEAL